MPLIGFLVAGAVAFAGWKVTTHPPSQDEQDESPDPSNDIAPIQASSASLQNKSIDREIKHNLILSSSAFGLIASSTFLPFLMWPGIGLLLVSLIRNLRKVLEQIKQGKISVTLLDTVAFTLPMILQFWLMAAMTSTFISTANWLSRRTERRSQEDLALLFSQQIRTAWTEHNGVLIEVPCSELDAGDVVVVDAGMPIPVDGKIVKGLGRVDQQALTGEAQPVDKAVGDEVLAATLLLDGKLFIELQQSGSKSMAAELTKLLTNMDNTRQESQSRAQKLVDDWVPLTLGTSALMLATRGVGSSLAVVYSGIGYPLRYAGPTAVLNHIQLAANSGLLIRDGRALEALANVDLVVFDKTGTLTNTVPTVHRITGVGQFEALEVLRIAATAENHQTHPLAYAISQAAEQSGISLAHIEGVEVELGMGLHVEIEGKAVLVGSERLLKSENIEVSTYNQDVMPEDIVVYVAVDGELAGFIELSPSIRDEAETVVQSLQAMGVEVVVLSGDRETPTRELANRLHLDGYYAEVMPQEKAQVIEDFQAKGRKVCFVGDGINDAVALRTADVSISLKGATSIAESAASILLMSGNLGDLPELFKIAQNNDRNLDRAVTLTTVTGIGTMAGVVFFNLGTFPAMVIYLLTITGSMLNASTPLFKQLVRQKANDAADVDEPNQINTSAPILRQWIEHTKEV
ncbi:heavy metal translocating P-type ATPase [Candidatus Albibeggiatoa sp. nov. NOAA]|uniref:heavy metal translocating P-type ATPase n=1 Tax=Candidatus Albibeggiatoa sp. nov. NOAA TaxID=3162724 RepID=UPI0032F5283B|nr:heavy metal translocating P-type ATPase [Thiotrichaceae bacterium]